MRMLDGNADGDLAGSRFVERIAVGIAALIDCGAGSVANTGQHRVLASELEIRLVIGIYDRMRCLGERYDLHGTGLRLREANLHAAGVVGGGFRIAPADIDRHHFIRYTLVVGHGPDIAAQLVVRHPDMPAPHDTAVRVTHGHDSVALLDRRLRHVEGQAVLVGRKPDIRHQIFLVLPNEYGIQGRTPRIVIDIGIGDSRIEMVYEGLQYGCFAGLRSVGRSVRTAVLDSVTIDQRQGVLSRGVDDVTVGGPHRGRAAGGRKIVRAADRSCRFQSFVMRIGSDTRLSRNRSRERRGRRTAVAARGKSCEPFRTGDHVVAPAAVILDKFGGPGHRNGSRSIARTGNGGIAGHRIIFAASGIGKIGRSHHGKSRSDYDARRRNPVSDGSAHRPLAACDRGG